MGKIVGRHDPGAVDIVRLFERFHVEMRNLRRFRRRVRGGVGDFRLHPGCVDVLELAVLECRRQDRLLEGNMISLVTGPSKDD